jgi:hypothetical protein
MRCPYCSENTPDGWTSIGFVPGSSKDFTSLSMEWMRCANDECGQAVVRVSELRYGLGPGSLPEAEVVQWLARPRTSSRPVDPLVKDPFRADLLEAASIVDLSPRMSAVLSRRVLADLLEDFAGLTQFNLEGRVDAFIADEKHPSHVRDNLHHLREIANFGAHTQKDEQDEVIDVSHEEAEWTLDVIESLFDYFIIGPERSRRMRESLDKKISDAGRKPIAPESV